MPDSETELATLLREVRDNQREHIERIRELTQRDAEFQDWVREQARHEAEYRRLALRQQRVVVFGLLVLGAFFVLTQAFDLPFP